MSVEAVSVEGEAPSLERSRPSRASRRRVLVLRLAQVLRLTVVAGVAVAFGLVYGFSYGISNHNSYLFGGLHLLDRGAYAKDWLVSQTTNYHLAFEYVAWALFKVSRKGWGFAIANVVCTMGYAGLFYWILTKLVRRRDALPSFLLLMAILFVTLTSSAGTSYISEGILQPSSLGCLGILLAIGFFLDGRWLACGVALALGGLFHGNYMVLGLLVFGLAQALLGTSGIVRRFAAQVGPAIPVLFLMSPILIAAATDPGRQAARDIMFKIRSPHHFSPRGYESAFIPVFAWQVLGLGSASYLFRSGKPVGERLGALAVGLLVVIWGGTAATTAFDMGGVQQLFVARLCPISDALFQMLACAAVARALTRPASTGPLRSVPKDSVALVVIGLSVLCMYYGNHRGADKTIPAQIGIVCIATAAAAAMKLSSLAIQRFSRFGSLVRARRLLLRHGAWIVALGCGGLWFGVAQQKLNVDSIKARSSLLKEQNPGEHELFAWIGRHTPLDALFLSPPDMQDFRLGSERAIVVDWKTPPFLPKEVLEWYRRLGDVAGRHVGSQGDVGSGYRDLDAKRVESLRAKYGIAYVVVSRGSKLASAHAYAPVFEGRSYTVLDANTPVKAAPAPEAPPPRDTDPDTEPVPTIQ